MTYFGCRVNKVALKMNLSIILDFLSSISGKVSMILHALQNNLGLVWEKGQNDNETWCLCNLSSDSLSVAVYWDIYTVYQCVWSHTLYGIANECNVTAF